MFQIAKAKEEAKEKVLFPKLWKQLSTIILNYKRHHKRNKCFVVPAPFRVITFTLTVSYYYLISRNKT